MVQPKYNPEEALQRVKLMMSYDSKKTLTENKEIIFEQQSAPVDVVTGAGIGAIQGAVAGAYTGAALGTAGFPVVGTAIGAVVGAGLGALLYWWGEKDQGSEGFKQVMSVCPNSALVPQLTPQEHRNIAYAIQDAQGTWNDNEEAIVNALKRIPTVGDLCKVNDRFPQGLYEFLDGVTDSESEWRLFTRPLADMVEDTKFVVKKQDLQKAQTSGGGAVVDTASSSVKKSTYKPCTGTYQFGCKSDAIAKVQSCLGLVSDGKFGPKTRAALKKKGITVFGDADIERICKYQEEDPSKYLSDVIGSGEGIPSNTGADTGIGN